MLPADRPAVVGVAMPPPPATMLLTVHMMNQAGDAAKQS
jgi:hypothetical protein